MDRDELRRQALKLREEGIQVLPTGGDKRPARKWKNHQDKLAHPNKVGAWFSSHDVAGACIVTGRVSGVVVLDCDSPDAEAWWRQQLGDDLLDSTVCVKSPSGNHHFWFALPEGRELRGWSQHDDLSFDVRAEGGIALVPPTDGYTWVRSPWDTELAPAPRELWVRDAGGAKGGGGSGSDSDSGGNVRSSLAHLLTNPPEGDGSGRNTWLARVAGHYAKQFSFARDAYDLHVDQAAAMLQPALPDNEVSKLRESIWTSEQEKGRAHPDELTEDNGWLKNGPDGWLHAATRTKVDDVWVEAHGKYGTFTITALGKSAPDDDGRIHYLVRVTRKDGYEFDSMLDGRTLGARDRLNVWMAQRGIGIADPEGVWPKGVPPGERLVRFLNSQNPPEFQVVDCMGWDDNAEAIVTLEGDIRPGGTTPPGAVRPHPDLARKVRFHYGVSGDIAATRDLIREVLTYHHSEFAALFGSWWAATLVKPLIQRQSSIFPALAVEAPSESGKTTGMLPMLVQLSGNQMGASLPTRAVTRDRMSTHSSGIVWIDDANDLDPYVDLLRAATAGGTVDKMGEDFSVVEARLVSPVLLTGEGLGVRHEKALSDRTLVIPASNPTNRTSTRGDYPQWDDVVATRVAHPDMSEYAGWVVALALQAADRVLEPGAFRRMKSASPGRQGDKLAVLRLGSRILSEMTGDSEWADRVDRWVEEEQLADQRENAMTLEIVPVALSILGHPTEPRESRHEDRPHTPAYVDEDGRVWVSPVALAEWWRGHRRGRIDPRTHTEAAFRDQLAAMGSADKKRVKIRDEMGMLPRERAPVGTFYSLPDDIGQEVRRRAMG